MQQELLVAIIAGVGGMIGWGLADFFAKKTIDRIGDVQSLAWAGVFGTMVFLAAAGHRIWSGGVLEMPQAGEQWLLLAFFGALQAAVYLFAYNGFSKGQVALLTPVFAAFSGVVAIVSILFLGEATTLWRIVVLGVIFLGIIGINLDIGALRNRSIAFTAVPGLREILAAMVLAAVWTLLWDRFVGDHDALAYALYMFVFMTVAVFVFAWIRQLPMRVGHLSIWWLLFLIGACETVAYLAITWGYGSTSLTSIVSLLSGGFSLPTIVLAWLFLKERLTSAQIIGCIAIVAGSMLLPLV